MKKYLGFSLIELMIVITIIGILAAVAVPSYQDYVIRAKISEAMVALNKMKTESLEHYYANGAFPTTADVGKVVTDYAFGIVTKGELAPNGYYGGAGPFVQVYIDPTVFNISGLTTPRFALVGTENNGVYSWACYTNKSTETTTHIPAKYLPNDCAPHP